MRPARLECAGGRVCPFRPGSPLSELTVPTNRLKEPAIPANRLKERYVIGLADAWTPGPVAS